MANKEFVTAGARRGTWLVLGAAMLWGTTGTAQALAPPGADPAAVGALRLAIGGAALFLVALCRGSLKEGGHWPLLATACAGGCIAAYQVCFFAAVAKTGVAVGTMVGIGSSPIAAGIFAYLVRGERLGRRWLAATVLALAGCSLLLVAGGSININPGGIVLALGAGVAYALYTLAIKGLLEKHSPDAVMAVAFCLGALVLSPLLITARLGWLAEPRGLAVALHLGLITTALSYQLFARGLRQIPVATAVTLSLAEPLTAGLLGVVVLGERLAPAALAGMALIFSGLALLVVPKRK